MERTSLPVRLGMWRVTRHPVVRRFYERVESTGVFFAQLDRFEREAVTPAPGTPDLPDDIVLSVSTVSDRVPDHLVDEPLAPGDRIVRADREGTTVGVCCLSDRPVYVPELHRRLIVDGAYLWRLYVMPSERGQEIGTAIIARAVEATETAIGSDRIVALVAPDNLPSRRAFRSLGFHPTERFTSLGCRGYRRHRQRRLPLSSSPD